MAWHGSTWYNQRMTDIKSNCPLVFFLWSFFTVFVLFFFCFSFLRPYVSHDAKKIGGVVSSWFNCHFY